MRIMESPSHGAENPVTVTKEGTMSGIFTKSMARNIFYGGTVFFFLLFLALTFDSHQEFPKRDNNAMLTPQAKAGKKI